MSQTCPQCQSEVADDANNCSNCGSPLGASSTTAQAAPAMGAATAAPAAAGPATAGTASGPPVPAYKFDAARWSLADRIAGVATIVFFISLFLSWFGITVIGVSVTVERCVGARLALHRDDHLHPGDRVPRPARRVGPAAGRA